MPRCAARRRDVCSLCVPLASSEVSQMSWLANAFGLFHTMVGTSLCTQERNRPFDFASSRLHPGSPSTHFVTSPPLICSHCTAQREDERTVVPYPCWKIAAPLARIAEWQVHVRSVRPFLPPCACAPPPSLPTPLSLPFGQRRS